MFLALFLSVFSVMNANDSKMSPTLMCVGEKFNIHQMNKKQMPLNQIGKFSQLPKQHGKQAGPGAAFVANTGIQVVGFGLPAAVAGTVAVVVPGGPSIVMAAAQMCNASGVTAAYVFGVRATAKAAALACLLWPTP